MGPAALRLLFIPGICEAFFDGGMAVALFGMSTTFAFALGFILKAIGPALVIQCMFEVQQKRLGLEKAIPATVVAAASFDGERLWSKVCAAIRELWPRSQSALFSLRLTKGMQMATQAFICKLCDLLRSTTPRAAALLYQQYRQSPG